MKRIIIWMGFVLVIIFICIQFYPVEYTNPPVTDEIKAPEEVLSVLRNSCYDCHSNETRWPWYNRIVPASWLIMYDVTNGRANMNFSEWDIFEMIESDMKTLIIGAVTSGVMPPFIYKLGHPNAKLSNEDIAVLAEWAETK